jgi:ribosomal protein S17
MNNSDHNIKKLSGVVAGTSGTGTYKVKVTRTMQHPKYFKFVKKSKNYLVSSERELHIGEKVDIVNSQKVSKRKSFTVVNG